MNQLDLWGGGAQNVRGGKYIIEYASNPQYNSSTRKYLSVVCNKHVPFIQIRLSGGRHIIGWIKAVPSEGDIQITPANSHPWSPATHIRVINAAGLPIFTRPSLDGTLIGTVPQGAELEVLNTHAIDNVVFFHVKRPGETPLGWIRSTINGDSDLVRV